MSDVTCQMNMLTILQPMLVVHQVLLKRAWAVLAATSATSLSATASERQACKPHRCCILFSAGQKGSDVTAREATRKLVSAATQVDALQQVIERVDHLAAAYGIEVVHHQTQAKPALPAAETPGQELVPRSAHVVVQPNLWQPKNTIVRGTFRETVATRAGTNAAAAASVAKGVGSSSAAAAVADITNVVAALQQLPADQHKSDQLHKQHRLH